MAFKRAIFKEINNNPALLCSKCGKVIKLGKDFDEMEKHAYKGVVTMMAAYCEEHKYMEMFGMERKREMLRKGIQEKLREAIMMKNVLEIRVTRPNQELILMRGIPGSGKSTMARALVGEGIIHSTDDLIEASGDYGAFFKGMIESKDFSKLGEMHAMNFGNTQRSLVDGVSPVIVDNTHIKPSEAKQYVKMALEMGLSEDNIKIVDVGTGGVTAQVLSERNTHGVPLDKISSMISSHKAHGTLTVSTILEAKDMYNQKRVSYAGVMLDDKSKSVLFSELSEFIPKGWKTFAHHMTITFGKPLQDRGAIGNTVNLTATHVGGSDMAIAVKVEGYPSDNDIPHITIAVNVDQGGKPFMSNKITKWSPLNSPINLSGVVQEVLN
jgi:predicted kinase